MAANQNIPTTSFLLLFRNAGPETHQHLSPEEKAKLTKQWNDWYDRLATQGKVEHARPLGPQGRVVSGPRGLSVVDGPYAEAKEAVGGYFFLNVTDIDEATEIAKDCPGLSLGLTVEVRPVVEFSPVLNGVQGHAPRSL